MGKFIKIFVILISFTASSLAEVVKDIKISGNKRVSEETIKIYGDIKLNKEYSETDLNKILNNLYSTNFFRDIKIQLENNVLNINLIEYPVINQLLVLGEPKDSYIEEIKKLIQSKQKDSFIENILSKDKETIKRFYASIGYNFTEVDVKVRKIDKSNVDIILDINRGNRTKISKISFTGDKKVREKRLLDIIASEEDKFWKFISRNTKFSQNLVNLDLRLLRNYYRSIGYYDVKITSNSAEIQKDGNIELIYSIDAGTRYVIKKIVTEVDPVFDKNLFYPLEKDYKKIVGSYYSPFKIKKLLETIDELIENNNLQFVEHNVEELIEADTITIKFNVYEGEKILVERVDILGNNVTNESVIRSELEIDEGDPFTNLGLKKSIANIKSRNIFQTVDAKTENGSSKDLKIININVEEKATGEISAGAGVGTDGGSFAFNVSENNWLGEGKKVGFNMDVDSDSLRGTLNYTDPNYDFLGNSINYYVTSETNDKLDQGYENTVSGAGINTSFEQYKDIFVSLGLSASHDDLKTDSSASSALKKQSGTFSEVAGNYGFTYDKRNRKFMPTDGSIIDFRQVLPFYADKSFIENAFAASTYRTISENIIGAGKFYIAAVNGLGSDDVRLSKRKGLSTRRLRGFKKGKVGPVDSKDHVGGNYAAAINLEANLPNFLPEDTKTDVKLFLDFGNVWGVDYDDSLDDSNKIRSSTGAAANWLSPLGPMSFVFSTNLSKASTDETEGFNFNIGTTF